MPRCKHEGREENRSTGVVAASAVGFTLLVLLIVLNEILDLPHLLFNIPPTPINWAEMGMEVFLALTIGMVTVFYLSILASRRKPVEEALRESQQNFRNSLDSSPLGIRIVTADGELLYANEAILDIYGYSSIEELKAVPAKRHYTPESYAEHQERKRRRKLGTPVPAHYEISIVRKDSEVRVLAVFRKKIIWDGKTQYQTLYQDITERKRAEAKLKESEQKLRLMFESLTDGITVADLRGVITDCNEKTVYMHGFSKKEDLVGENAFKLIAHRDNERAAVNMQKTLQVGAIRGIEYTLLKADGSEFPGELSASVLRDAYDNPAGFIAITRDVTQRKQVEMALRQSEEFNSSLLINSPNPIIVLNADASIRYVNPALERLTGFSYAELTGRKPPYPWWIEQMIEESSKELEKSIRRGVRKYEQLFVSKNGKQFWVEITFKTVEMNGEFKYYLANWVNLTEQKRLRQNMQFYISRVTMAQEEERKRIACEIHDESVQSLAALALEIDGLTKNKERLPKDIIQCLQGIRAESNRILEGLRQFSHELRPGVIDQVGLVPALEILTEEMNKQGINTSLQIMGSEQRLTSEKELGLFRIAQEALRNIRRHSGATTAKIRINFNQHKVKLIMSDNGSGFEVPEVLGDLARKDKLGLIGMHERSRLLNGKFSIKSRVGKGTTVIVQV